ncbi:endoplasmic reticulum membrane-associated RNA degradation protein-like [Daphnia carinata]|uniref:endoplasmic reticulum membrane-associated RNA degradation protein-like n=1 Tax=Daphnia carinata TaxID=120202 RepID=UPI00257A9BDE|nr:endoplasmic reticulum membrane-associated RNA degradation protein-like [Daphnia carinata]
MKEIVGRWYKIVENTPTYLSRSVQDLVLKKGFVGTASSDASLKFATDDLLDISNVSSLLRHADENLLHPTERNAEWYSQTIDDVAPYLENVRMKMKVMPQEELKGLMKLCAWMHQPQIIYLCFDLLSREDEVALNSHECLLLITAALERALGNLFLHGDRNKKVPSLFRDLLASRELHVILGISQVVLLQLLLGNPLSLNLRNLIWHGFVSFLDWDTHGYASVLLFVCASIGRHLDGCRSIVSVNEIIPRRWATFKQHQQGRKWPKWSEFMEEEMLVEAVSTTRGLPSSRKAIWHRAIIHHQRGRYGRCCALIMPEIEHTLRLIYCATNDCPSRALTAESVVHYTTLDVILECGNGDDSNKPRMADFLGNGLFLALLDIFVQTEGPRVRDRFSHGECQLWDINVQLSRHLLALSTAILWRADDEKVSCVPHYSPDYTPAALFHGELIQTIQAIEHWLSLAIVDVDQPAVDLSAWPGQCLPLISDWLHNWSTSVNHLLINRLEEENSREINDVVIKTNRCPLSATWRRMMSQIALGSQRMTAHYNERNSSASSTLSSWSLRSRQRSTHARLDSYMCLFVRAVQLSLLFPIAVSCGGQVIVNHAPTVRRMKRNVTRWADNFASASVNNRWVDLAECAKESIQSMEILLASAVVFVQQNSQIRPSNSSGIFSSVTSA